MPPWGKPHKGEASTKLRVQVAAACPCVSDGEEMGHWFVTAPVKPCLPLALRSPIISGKGRTLGLKWQGGIRTKLTRVKSNLTVSVSKKQIKIARNGSAGTVRVDRKLGQLQVLRFLNANSGYLPNLIPCWPFPFSSQSSGYTE